MDHEFIAAVEYEHDGFQQAPLCVESEPQLPRGAVIVEFFNP